MKGFRDFIMRGNLVELAVAFIVAGAFGALVESFTSVIMEGITKLGGVPNFNDWTVLGFTTVGPFLTALVSFLIIAAIVYFFVVKPYEAARERFFPVEEEEEAVEEDIALLREIRDALKSR